MKKLLSLILLVSVACMLLCACSQTASEAASGNTGAAREDVAASMAQNVSHAEYMVSDGEYIYYCPTEPEYPDSDLHFGVPRSWQDDFICSLRRLSVSHAMEEPLIYAEYFAGDGKDEGMLAEQNCRWLCLDGEYVYFVDTDENVIYRMKTSGGETVPIYTGEEPFNDLEQLNVIGEYLYFTEDTSLKRLKTDSDGDVPQTVFTVDHDFAVFAEEKGADFIENYFALPYAFEEYGGQLYMTVGSGVDYYRELFCLIRIDIGSEGFPYELVCGSTACDLALCGGKLYYQQPDGTSMFGDLMLHLMAYDGEQATDTGVFTDSRDLFSDGSALYYDKYIDTTEEYFEYIETYGEDPDFDFVDGRFLFSYTESGGERQLETPSDIMYIDGAAEGVIWYENSALHVWVSENGGEPVYMATEGVYDPTPAEPAYDPEEEYYESEYGPGISYLDLDADELSACFRLLRTDGIEEFRVFLEPGTSCTKSFPSGRYILKIAEGETWISDEEAFGSGGHYSTTDYYFFEAGASYYIGAGTTGDFYNEGVGGFLS